MHGVDTKNAKPNIYFYKWRRRERKQGLQLPKQMIRPIEHTQLYLLQMRDVRSWNECVVTWSRLSFKAARSLVIKPRDIQRCSGDWEAWGASGVGATGLLYDVGGHEGVSKGVKVLLGNINLLNAHDDNKKTALRLLTEINTMRTSKIGMCLGLCLHL